MNMFARGRFRLHVAATCKLFLLVGCAHAPPPPPTVSVPVAVDCAAKVTPPSTYAADAVGLDSNIFELVKALLIDREQRRSQEAELRAALRGCAG